VSTRAIRTIGSAHLDKGPGLGSFVELNNLLHPREIINREEVVGRLIQPKTIGSLQYIRQHMGPKRVGNTKEKLTNTKEDKEIFGRSKQEHVRELRVPIL
jgi:hypothetical protein